MSVPYSARARSTTRTRTHDLRRDIGRHGLIDTVSPSLHSLFSSCASSFVVRRMYLPYIGCLTSRSIETATVLSILLLTTLPVSSRCPGMGAAPRSAAAVSVVCTSDITISPCASRNLSTGSRRPRQITFRCAGGKSSTHLLGEHRLNARNVLTHLRKLIRLRGLARGARHAQVELFAAQLEKLLAEILGFLAAQIFRFHVRTFMPGLGA